MPSNIRLNAYGGHNIPVLGKVHLNCKWNDKSVHTEFVIVPLDVKTIIGLDTSSRLELVTPRVASENHSTSPHSHKYSGCDGNNNLLGHTPPHNHENVSSVASHPSPIKSDHGGNSDLDLLLTKYKDVFDETKVGCMTKHPYHIRLKPDPDPKVHAPRKVAFAIEDDVEQELKRMEKLGVIAKVDGPTDWVNSMVIVTNPKLRICLDPLDLNKAVRREHTALLSPDEALAKLSGAQVFSKVDLRHGYWQVPLTESSSYLTTFNTPAGRYRYTRLPFGLNSANEVFQKRVSQVYEGLPGVIVIFDDILIYAKDKEEHNRSLELLLKRTQENGIQLNRKKCKFYVDELTYIGHVISKDGVKPDFNKISDIMNMPAPQNKTGVQRLLGMVTYLAKFIPNMSQLTHPIRTLLNKDTHFHWSYEQDKALEKIKETLTRHPVLAFYDVKKDIELHADSSEYGLGATIIQDDRPVAYASRSLTNTERRYAQIEKELLSVVFGCERFHQYLFAKQVTVYTDHKPLVAIVDKPVNTASARIQRLLLRLQKYSIQLLYKPGKFHTIPDTLSRACVTGNMSDTVLEGEIEYMIDAVFESIDYPDSFKKLLAKETAVDPCLKVVIYYLEHGWPTEIKNCHENARLYWSIRDELCYHKSLVLFRDRIVVPKALQAECLKRLHTAHLGRVKCKASARKAIYWRGINSDIDIMVDKCEICLTYRNNPNKEPLIPHTVPERPFQKVAADIFTLYGHQYQIIVDYFSKWPEVLKLSTHQNSGNVIRHMRSVFSRFGIPEIIFSDNESIYCSAEFNNFCKEYDIKNEFSSARWAQSNGQVERCIQTIKRIIKKCSDDKTDFHLALLQYRNTPLDNSVDSPSKLLLGRNLRTVVPSISDNLVTSADIENRKLLKCRQDVGKKYYDRTAGKDRPQFKPGQVVAYRDSLADSYYKSGLVLSNKSQRSCSLLNDKGNVVTRNNRMLLQDRTDRQFTVIPEHLPEFSKPATRSARPSLHVPRVSDETNPQSHPRPPISPVKIKKSRVQRFVDRSVPPRRSPRLNPEL